MEELNQFENSKILTLMHIRTEKQKKRAIIAGIIFGMLMIFWIIIALVGEAILDAMYL